MFLLPLRRLVGDAVYTIKDLFPRQKLRVK